MIGSAVKRLDRLNGRLWCWLLGHEPSWMLAWGLGFNRPVCSRCRRVL